MFIVLGFTNVEEYRIPDLGILDHLSGPLVHVEVGGYSTRSDNSPNLHLLRLLPLSQSVTRVSTICFFCPGEGHFLQAVLTPSDISVRHHPLPLDQCRKLSARDSYLLPPQFTALLPPSRHRHWPSSFRVIGFRATVRRLCRICLRRLPVHDRRAVGVVQNTVTL